jgi:hypothetical protein
MTNILKHYEATFRLTCKLDDGSLVASHCVTYIDARNEAEAAHIVRTDEHLSWETIASAVGENPEDAARAIEDFEGQIVDIEVLDVRENV